MERICLSRRVGLRTMQGGIGVSCKVNIVVQDGSETLPSQYWIVINGVKYYHGDKLFLAPGTYTLDADGIGGYSFESYAASGKLSLADPLVVNTDLTVSCGGILTLNVQHVCEDFTFFTPSAAFKLQPGGSVTACLIYKAIPANYEERYIYKDYGVGNFTDFIHAVNYQANIYGFNGDYGRHIFWMLSNDIGGWHTLQIGGKSAVAVMWSCPGGNLRLTILEAYGGSEYSAYCDIPYQWPYYYVTIEKAGTILYVKLYSDEERTNLVANTSLALHEDYSFRYLTASSSYLTGLAEDMTGSIAKLDLNYTGHVCVCP